MAGKDERFDPRRLGRRGTAVAVVLAVLVVIVAVAGAVLYERQRADLRRRLEDQTGAIAQLDAGAVASALDSYRGFLERPSQSTFFSSGVAEYLVMRKPGPAERRLRDRLSSEIRPGGFHAMFLLDRTLTTALTIEATGTNQVMSPEALAVARQTTVKTGVRRTDLYRSLDEGRLVIDFVAELVPLAPGAESPGYLVARVDAADLLLPKSAQWPAAAGSAESFLVRRDGEDVLYMTPLKFARNAALELHRPLVTPTLGAANGARGLSGPFEGVDYRGVSVLGYTRPVPGTDWAVVAELESSEAYAPLQMQMFYIVALLVVVTGFATTVVVTLWRGQRAEYFRSLYESHEDVRRSEERLRLALEATADGLWEIDLEHGTFYFSPTYYTMLGYEPGDFPAGTNAWEDLLHPDDCEGAVAELGRIYGGLSPFTVEFRMRAKDGQWRWILSRGSIVKRDSDGAPARILGTHVDVTALKATEEELERHRLHLEDLVQERTRDLQAANRAKSEFLASMSHELRTPLNSIIGFSGVLLQGLAGEVNEEQQRQIGMIQRSGRHLLALINDVLDLSKIEAGRSKLDLRSYVLQDILDGVVDSLRPLADGKDLDLVLSVTTRPIEMVSDQIKLTQVLLNLIGNALKFTDAGGVTVRAAGLADGMVRMEVEDTGPGIAADEIERIFEPFSQGVANDGMKPPGTGLGLSLSREYVDMLGGVIGVESRPGGGALFTVTIPRVVYAESGEAGPERLAT